MMDKERRWFVGIDWGSQEHVVSLCDESGEKIGQRKFPHGGTGLSDMIAWLLQVSGGKPGEIHVAIETPHGPIVEALLERGFNMYSINPKQLDRFRDRFTVADLAFLMGMWEPADVESLLDDAARIGAGL